MIRSEYKKLMRAKKELYKLSGTISFNELRGSLDDYITLLNQIHNMDWEDLTNRQKSYLNRLRWALNKDEEGALKMFKCIQ